MADRSNRTFIGLAAGAAIGSAAIAAAVMFTRRDRSGSVSGIKPTVGKKDDDRPDGTPAALVHPVAAPDAPASVRDAGPSHIRDGVKASEWDQVDEASDESFPASDPPSQ